MKKYQVLDDVISVGYQDWIKDYMTSPVFPWFYMNNVTRVADNSNGGFSHLMYGPPNNANSTIESIMPILFGVLGDKQPTELLRIRAAMFTKNQSGPDATHHAPHIDLPKSDKPYKVMIYYVLDSDGSTGIFEGDELIEEVEPKKGRVLLMDGDVLHASQCPKMHNQRIVINYNYRI